jgi:polar amino acid transport system substrate-binding protein
MKARYSTPERGRQIVAAVAMACVFATAGQSFAQQRTIADIKAAGELLIGDEATYVPFAYRDGDQIVGYDIDVAAEFCKTLAVKCTVVDTVWAGIVPALLANKFDFIMGQYSYSPERVASVGFTIPYVDASQALLIRAEDANKIKTLNDLSGKVLGVKLGSPGATNQEAINAAIAKETGAALAEVRTYDDHPTAYLALADGRVDGVLNSFTTLARLLKDQPGKYAIVSNVGEPNSAGLVARETDTELLAFLNEQILKLKADGTLGRLQEKWFGVTMDLPDVIPTFK